MAPPPPATIWSFDLSKELWSRVEASDVPAAEAAAVTTVAQRATVSWPAARTDGSVIGAYSGGGSGGAESDAGWVVGGVGDRECRRSTTSGFTMPTRLQELTGLWRLVLVGDKS